MHFQKKKKMQSVIPRVPLKLSHTVVDIKGRERVEGITLAQVDEHNKPIEGTEEFYECDTLLLSSGK